MYKFDLVKICNLLNCKTVTCQKCSFAEFAKLQLPNRIFSKNTKRYCQNSRHIKCAKMSLSKFAHLANTKNDALQTACLASMRFKSMPENAFDILKTVHLVKTQKRLPKFGHLANTKNDS